MKPRPATTVLAFVIALASNLAAAAEVSATAAAELYKAKCLQCHLADGNSPIEGLNFTDGKWKYGNRSADIAGIIAEGAPGTAMLPFKEQLSPAEIDALARYVRAFDKALKPEKGGKKK